ncbi:hypothetical protein IEQ34_013406 [Dendrobium chrysotoxum]|uniref:Uncharacterized protein n=1 Tax=Dendrobium chrysotoxum TaxID=161865 RepID=A0AAV7GPN7_DENCH|nr:hypothetical protein IEQ34_013406 [Dendrobium chrysotoxum]
MRKLGGSSVFPRELFGLLSATKHSGLSPLELTFAEFLPQFFNKFLNFRFDWVTRIDASSIQSVLIQIGFALIFWFSFLEAWMDLYGELRS